MQKLSNDANGDFQKYKADIARYFPDLEDLLNWGRYCTHIGFPDRFTQRILAQEKVGFAGALFSSEHNQTFRTEGSVAKLERDPENKHRFILNIDGVSVFQWFRIWLANSLRNSVSDPKSQRNPTALDADITTNNYNGYLSTSTSIGEIAVIFIMHYKSV